VIGVASVVFARLEADKVQALGYHGRLRCSVCGHEEHQDPFTGFLRGFTKHCGHTMVMVKEPEEENVDGK